MFSTQIRISVLLLGKYRDTDESASSERGRCPWLSEAFLSKTVSDPSMTSDHIGQGLSPLRLSMSCFRINGTAPLDLHLSHWFPSLFTVIWLVFAVYLRHLFLPMIHLLEQSHPNPEEEGLDSGIKSCESPAFYSTTATTFSAMIEISHKMWKTWESSPQFPSGQTMQVEA